MKTAGWSTAEERKEAAWWLNKAPGFGAVKLRMLTQCAGSAEEILWESGCLRQGSVSADSWYQEICSRYRQCGLGEDEAYRFCLKPADLEALGKYSARWSQAQDEYEKCSEAGIRFVSTEDDEYPERLLPLYDHPYGLYLRGELPDPAAPAAAVVGARACSSYGRTQSVRFARELAASGVKIISGLAFGIDSAGHRGALDSGVKSATFAVLGCGPDLCYPPEHEELAEEIIENGGGLISEYSPGTRPVPGHFPQRNRIISGLSDCVLVMEARRRSGSLITADAGLEQGREIFALPGHVGDPLSEGCHNLIAAGAAILTDSSDVLSFLLPNRLDSGNKGDAAAELSEKSLAMQKDLVYSCLDCQEKTMDDIAALTGLPLNQIQIKLLDLLLSGLIEETARGHYIRRPQ